MINLFSLYFDYISSRNQRTSLTINLIYDWILKSSQQLIKFIVFLILLLLHLFSLNPSKDNDLVSDVLLNC